MEKYGLVVFSATMPEKEIQAFIATLSRDNEIVSAVDGIKIHQLFTEDGALAPMFGVYTKPKNKFLSANVVMMTNG